MDENGTGETSRVLRLFGAQAGAVELAAAKLRGVRAQCASRGGETLVALRAEKSASLEKAEKSLRSRFANDLYGSGSTTLTEALVAELEKHDKMFVCADTAAGAMAEGRLEAIEGAERVFDFGRLSYGQPGLCAKADALVKSRAGDKSDEQKAAARLKAVLHLAGVELAAACVERADGALLLVGTHKGCWLRRVSREDNPGLWLLDMVRRAAAGLRQADGTSHQSYRNALRRPKAAPAPAARPERPVAVTAAAAAIPARHSGHILLRLLAALLLLALLAVAFAWYYTGGDLTAFPERLGLGAMPGSGALLV